MKHRTEIGAVFGLVLVLSIISAGWELAQRDPVSLTPLASIQKAEPAGSSQDLRPLDQASVDPTITGLSYDELINRPVDFAHLGNEMQNLPGLLNNSRRRLSPMAARTIVSHMPIIVPRGEIDRNMPIKWPDPSIDYKLIVKTPDVESVK